MWRFLPRGTRLGKPQSMCASDSPVKVTSIPTRSAPFGPPSSATCGEAVVRGAASSEKNTITCHMSRRDRTKRCDTKFSRRATVVVDGQELGLVLFVTAEPCSARQRNTRSGTFRSPNARLKLELRCDSEQIDDQVMHKFSCAHMIFSMGVLSKSQPDMPPEVQQVEMVEHVHDFARASSCICPVMFVPPATDDTWVIAVEFLSTDAATCAMQFNSCQ